MITNMNIFLNGDSILPTLYMDMVLVESTRPIMFTCTDLHDGLYICSCHCANGEKCEWIIVRTTPERVIELLRDQLTIRNIFSQYEKTGFIVTLRAGEKSPTVKKVLLDEIPDNILPTAGYCLGVEDGEFDEEITDLKDRIAIPMEVEHTRDSFSVTLNDFSIMWSLPSLNCKSTEYKQSRKSFRIVAGV